MFLALATAGSSGNSEGETFWLPEVGVDCSCVEPLIAALSCVKDLCNLNLQSFCFLSAASQSIHSWPASAGSSSSSSYYSAPAGSSPSSFSLASAAKNKQLHSTSSTSRCKVQLKDARSAHVCQRVFPVIGVCARDPKEEGLSLGVIEKRNQEGLDKEKKREIN